MLNSIILQLEIAIREFGVLGVFFAALTEQIIAPIPSAAVAMLAGFFLVPYDLSFWHALGAVALNVGLPMSLGMTTGSLIIYALAHFGGKPLIIRYGKWLGISWQATQDAKLKFSTGHADEIILLIVRIVPLVPGAIISAFCGLVRYDLKKFALITLAGTFAGATTLATIGWKARGAYAIYADFLDQVGLFLFAGLVVIIALFLIWKKTRARPTGGDQNSKSNIQN